jgi:hypothetical protein
MSNVSKQWVEAGASVTTALGMMKAPPPSRVAPKIPSRSRSKISTDVVYAVHGKLLDSARCSICGGKYKVTDAVVRTRDLSTPSAKATSTHRRCMEDLLSSSVEDQPIEQSKFEKYRQQVADKNGIEA